jgi:hypothetical protein
MIQDMITDGMKHHNAFSKPTAALSALSLLLLVPIIIFALSFSVTYGDSRAEVDQPSGPAERPASQGFGANPPSGPPGSRISVSGSGFRDFAPVESITLGGLNILGNRTVTTDGDGRFQVDELIVPGLDPGIVSLVIRVGTGDLETAATGTFEVTAPAGPSGSVSTADEALAPLGDALERVFHFDNGTKTWSFFDPRPEFADINTLNEVVEGEVYWIKVTRSIAISLNSEQRQLSCTDEGTPQQDCWNLVVW